MTANSRTVALVDSRDRRETIARRLKACGFTVHDVILSAHTGRVTTVPPSYAYILHLGEPGWDEAMAVALRERPGLVVCYRAFEDGVPAEQAAKCESLCRQVEGAQCLAVVGVGVQRGNEIDWCRTLEEGEILFSQREEMAPTLAVLCQGYLAVALAAGEKGVVTIGDQEKDLIGNGTGWHRIPEPLRGVLRDAARDTWAEVIQPRWWSLPFLDDYGSVDWSNLERYVRSELSGEMPGPVKELLKKLSAGQAIESPVTILQAYQALAGALR